LKFSGCYDRDRQSFTKLKNGGLNPKNGFLLCGFQRLSDLVPAQTVHEPDNTTLAVHILMIANAAIS